MLYPKLNKGHVANQEFNSNLQGLESDPPDNNSVNLDERYLCLTGKYPH